MAHFFLFFVLLQPRENAVVYPKWASTLLSYTLSTFRIATVLSHGLVKIMVIPVQILMWHLLNLTSLYLFVPETGVYFSVCAWILKEQWEKGCENITQKTDGAFQFGYPVIRVWHYNLSVLTYILMSIQQHGNWPTVTSNQETKDDSLLYIKSQANIKTAKFSTNINWFCQWMILL